MVNVKNAFIANPHIDGGVYFNAELGTEFPETPVDRPSDEWADHGALGEDGFAVSQQRSSNDVRMFGGGVFIDTQTEYNENVVLTLLEDDNEAVLNTTFGDANVVTTEANDQDGTRRTIYHTDAPLPIKAHIVRAISGDKTKLYCIERGRVAEIAEVTESHSDVTRRQLTIKCFKSTNPEFKGAYVVEMRDDGTPVPVAGDGGDSGNG